MLESTLVLFLDGRKKQDPRMEIGVQYDSAAQFFGELGSGRVLEEDVDEGIMKKS